MHENRKVQVGNDQEKAQSEKDSHSKNRVCHCVHIEIYGIRYTVFAIRYSVFAIRYTGTAVHIEVARAFSVLFS